VEKWRKLLRWPCAGIGNTNTCAMSAAADSAMSARSTCTARLRSAPARRGDGVHLRGVGFAPKA
jgi:hypothetical protein